MKMRNNSLFSCCIFLAPELSSISELFWKYFFLKGWRFPESRKHYGRTVIDRRKACKTIEIWRKVLKKIFLTIKIEAICCQEMLMHNVVRVNIKLTMHSHRWNSSNDLHHSFSFGIDNWCVQYPLILYICLKSLNILLISITTYCVWSTTVFLRANMGVFNNMHSAKSPKLRKVSMQTPWNRRISTTQKHRWHSSCNT